MNDKQSVSNAVREFHRVIARAIAIRHLKRHRAIQAKSRQQVKVVSLDRG